MQTQEPQIGDIWKYETSSIIFIKHYAIRKVHMDNIYLALCFYFFAAYRIQIHIKIQRGLFAK